MTVSTSGARVLFAPKDENELDRMAASFGTDRAEAARHVALDAETVDHDLARLALTVIELLRQVIEKQATRRVENGTLTDEQIERLGRTLIALERRMEDLKGVFGLEGKDLTLNLGPLGDLL